jgi:hypothetical protein
MRLSGRLGAPKPTALIATIGKIDKRSDQRLVAGTKKTAEYRVIGKAQWQSQLTQN